MNGRYIFIAIGVFIGLFIALYFIFTINSLSRSSSDCVSLGGYCIPASEGCFNAGLMPYSEGICYEANGRVEDVNNVCCLAS